ncbi:hypothetical protein AAFF_G00006070 [Aldrovandia affinis]|uniref:Uncharacterized protein n=1 Tax=Aldrovandia affinis TaxID=143900 RepID=A0AAD7TE71_9TELE|nr:hypothetical protein AAFF_G00006070 [Aldrovandia affinis]
MKGTARAASTRGGDALRVARGVRCAAAVSVATAPLAAETLIEPLIKNFTRNPVRSQAQTAYVCLEMCPRPNSRPSPLARPRVTSTTRAKLGARVEPWPKGLKGQLRGPLTVRLALLQLQEKSPRPKATGDAPLSLTRRAHPPQSPSRHPANAPSITSSPCLQPGPRPSQDR